MSSFTVEITGASYAGLVVLPALRLSIPQGKVLALLGSNGAGKSTGLKATMGAVSCQRRSLRLGDEDLSRYPTWRLPLEGIVMVPDGTRCFPNLSIYENLRGAYTAVAPPGAKGQKNLRKTLETVYELFPLLHARGSSRAGTLSGGQRQMLAIGRAMMADPRVLILDEPSSGLAPKVIEELFETLARIKRESNRTILLAEQSVAAASFLADECVVIEEGKVAISGPMDAVRRDERLNAAYLGAL